MQFLIALCLVTLAYAANPTCQLKPETGPCRAYIPSYYFDPSTSTCETFVYGGCGGNENRFETREECEEACGVRRANVEICHLEPETGMCKAYMPRYYYDVKAGECKKFIYGGCQGNPNNFHSFEECEAACVPMQYAGTTCEQKPDPGHCKGYFPRYYYDKTTNECKQFIFGGCGGNDNNFDTEEGCLTTCGDGSRR